jgi:hypothetical protein
MTAQDYIPRTDVKFLVWVRILFTEIGLNATAWNIDAADIASITPLIAAFDATMAKANEPNRGKADVKKKDDARDTLKTAVRQFYMEHLAHNSHISDDERERIGLPVYKTVRTPAPIAKDPPDADIDASQPGRVIIHFFERGSNHKKGKPEGQHGAEIAWVISDVPPTRWNELLHSNIDTNSPYTLVFENDQRGKKLYIALRWENTRGEKGPWSNILSAIIP